MTEEMTQEMKELALSAEDAHNLMEMTSSKGWKVLKEMYFDVKMRECKEYLFDVKNTDPVMVRAMVMKFGFIENLLDDIKLTIEIGLAYEKELLKMKEEKKK